MAVIMKLSNMGVSFVDGTVLGESATGLTYFSTLVADPGTTGGSCHCEVVMGDSGRL